MDVDIRRFEPGDRAAVVELWGRAELTRPWNDPELDINRKIASIPKASSSPNSPVGSSAP
jgi:hypothetical protein